MNNNFPNTNKHSFKSCTICNGFSLNFAENIVEKFNEYQSMNFSICVVDDMQTCSTKPLISHISQKPIEMALNYNIMKYIPLSINRSYTKNNS